MAAGGADGTSNLRRWLSDEARAQGFDAVAVASADSIQDAGSDLTAYLANGYHGAMHWMAETAERRADPRVLWPEARSVIMFAMNYGPDRDPMAAPAGRDRAAISVYAQNRDYHDIIKGRLKTVAGRLAAKTGCGVKVFVDTAPLMEKPLAQAAGIGWQGKHTNLVSREHGSWLFLGSIVTTQAMEPDRGETDRCGACRACLDICPTNAFPAPYRLDARRCISYLTIEHKGPIPHEFREKMGNRIFGCDDCLAVCPWNKFAHAATEAKLRAREELKRPKLADLLALGDRAFRNLFSGSPVKRVGRDRFIRNCLIAAGNSGERDLAGVCENLLADGSAPVRGAAVWALSRLVAAQNFLAARDRRFASETDEPVRDEWKAAVKNLKPAGEGN